jgi:hypothetical protein
MSIMQAEIDPVVKQLKYAYNFDRYPEKEDAQFKEAFLNKKLHCTLNKSIVCTV